MAVTVSVFGPGFQPKAGHGRLCWAEGEDMKICGASLDPPAKCRDADLVDVSVFNMS